MGVDDGAVKVVRPTGIVINDVNNGWHLDDIDQ
jgi:hypothetical protein